MKDSLAASDMASLSWLSENLLTISKILVHLCVLAAWRSSSATRLGRRKPFFLFVFLTVAVLYIIGNFVQARLFEIDALVQSMS